MAIETAMGQDAWLILFLRDGDDRQVGLKVMTDGRFHDARWELAEMEPEEALGWMEGASMSDASRLVLR